jgi:hypothetical protein
MPVDQDWLAGLPDVEDAASSDWEGAMDQNFMDFTRFGSDDMDSQVRSARLCLQYPNLLDCRLVFFRISCWSRP